MCAMTSVFHGTLRIIPTVCTLHCIKSSYITKHLRKQILPRGFLVHKTSSSKLQPWETSLTVTSRQVRKLWPHLSSHEAKAPPCALYLAMSSAECQKLEVIQTTYRIKSYWEVMVLPWQHRGPQHCGKELQGGV